MPFNKCKNKIKNEIEIYLSQVFINPDIKNYTKRFFASCLSGHNYDEKFHIFFGSGG